MNREKFPRLAEQFDALAAKKDATLLRLKPLREQEAAALAVAQEAEAKLRGIQKQIKAIEASDDLHGISLEMAALARGMGARSMAAEAA